MNIHTTLIGKVDFLTYLLRSGSLYISHEILCKAIHNWRDRKMSCDPRLLLSTLVKTLKYKICDLCREFFRTACNDVCIRTKSVKSIKSIKSIKNIKSAKSIKNIKNIKSLMGATAC